MAMVERGFAMMCHAVWRPVSMRDLDLWFDRYLAEVAAPALGLAVGEAEPPAPVALGRNALVRRWPTARGVLYARAWRYDPTIRPAREHAVAARLFAEAGLRVPELPWIDESFRTLRRYRLEATIETAAPGRSLFERIKSAPPEVPERLPDAIRRALARELRALHTRQGAAWGKPWRPHNEARRPLQYWLARVALWRGVVPAGALRLDRARVEPALRRLAAAVRRIEFGTPRLVHGDLSPAHLFWADAAAATAPDPARLTWIDFGTVHYGHPAQDLAQVAQWVCPPERWKAFLEAYMADEKFDRGRLQAAIDLFAELRMWDKLASRIAKRGNHAHRPDRLERLNAEQERIERRLAERYLSA
jgi:hypothetical protein